MVINIETNVVYALLSTIVALTLIVFAYKIIYMSKIFKSKSTGNDTARIAEPWPGEEH